MASIASSTLPKCCLLKRLCFAIASHGEHGPPPVIQELPMPDNTLVEEVARAICCHNSGGYCEFVGEGICRVGRGEPPEVKNCRMTARAMPLTREYLMAEAAVSIIEQRVRELEEENARLRSIMNEPTKEMLDAGMRAAE